MQREQLVKRCWEPELDIWSCRPKKRVRLEAGLTDGGGPMETLPALLRTHREDEKRGGQTERGEQVSVFRPPLTCFRCLAGEPGHINHMMPAGSGPSTNPGY
ncbi:uncharacterized protein LOC144038722 isoform X3 [Vanacampus margaritifer]